MLTLRYFVVIGVGAVISLNYVEPVSSKELLSLTKPISKQSQSQYPKPAVARTQEHPQETGEAALSSPTPSNLARESVEGEQSQPVASSTDELTKVAAEVSNTVLTYSEGDIPDPSPVLVLPQTVSEFTASIDAETTSTALQEGGWQSIGVVLSGSSRSSLDISENEKDLSPNLSPARREASFSPFPTREGGRGVRFLCKEGNHINVFRRCLLASPTGLARQEPLRGTSASVKEQPVQPLDREQFFVQSPESETTTEVDLLVEEIPSLEFLNPSANPLLFPTKPDEVQIENTQAITLEQALELAQINNREFQVARLELEKAQFVLQQALAAEFPTASFMADIIRTDSAQTEIQNRSTGFSQDTTSTVFNPMLTLSYNIFTSGRRSATIRRSEEGIRFRQLDLERIFEQLRLNVSQAYYQLQLADAQVIINQAAVTNAEEVLRDAQLREQAGLGTKFDVLQQQVQLANFIQDLTNARRDQRVARRQIVNLLSLAQDAEVSAADPITVAGQWELSIDESIVLAFKNRAELQQRLTERDLAEQDRLIALADIRPQISVFATYDVLDVFDDDVGPADGYTIGARFRWDFFDGGSARARARQAETDIAIADTNFADTRNDIRFQVEQAFFDLKANEQNIQTATLAVKQAEESLRLAELRVGAGVGTQLEVINQQTELTRARNNLVSAILNYNIGLANLQRAISNLPDSKLFDLTY